MLCLEKFIVTYIVSISIAAHLPQYSLWQKLHSSFNCCCWCLVFVANPHCWSHCLTERKHSLCVCCHTVIQHCCYHWRGRSMSSLRPCSTWGCHHRRSRLLTIVHVVQVWIHYWSKLSPICMRIYRSLSKICPPLTFAKSYCKGSFITWNYAHPTWWNPYMCGLAAEADAIGAQFSLTMWD